MKTLMNLTPHQLGCKFELPAISPLAMLSVLGEGSSGRVYDVTCADHKAVLKIHKNVDDMTNECMVLRHLSIGQSNCLTTIPRLVAQNEKARQLLMVPQGVPARRTTWFSSRQVVEFLHSVAYLHDQNVLHRDIRPENLVVYTKAHTLDMVPATYARDSSDAPAQARDLDSNVRYVYRDTLEQSPKKRTQHAHVVADVEPTTAEHLMSPPGSQITQTIITDVCSMYGANEHIRRFHAG